MKYLRNSINKIISSSLFFYLTLFAFSATIFYALGARKAILTCIITIFVSFLLAHQISRLFFILYASIIFFVTLCLLPTTLSYGRISLGMTMSVMQTNTREIYEYLTNIPVKNLLICLLYIILFSILLKIYKKYKGKIKGKALIITILLFLIGLLYSPIRDYREDNSLDYVELFSTSYYTPIKFIFSKYRHLQIYKRDKEKLLNAQYVPSTWEILSAQPRYQNYVIIIGESARRDYLSLYGYPIKTSPFMDRVNATIFNNYISPAPYTITSLKGMFIQNDKHNFNYSNNIISLANKAGFETYWISNQGYLGEFDTETSLLALNAKHTFFVNKMDYPSKGQPDLVLLPELDKILAEKRSKPKLIFMHLVGSHSRFCLRLDDSYKITPITGVINKEMSCYLSSLLQTDMFIKKTYDMLQKNKTSFSLMYFSDHGLGHKDKKHFYVNLRHCESFKQNYDVPMIVISSDDTSRTFINASKSGFDFIRQFSEWTNIRVKGIDTQKRFFSEYQPEKIQVLVKHLKNYDDLDNDPAILP